MSVSCLVLPTGMAVLSEEGGVRMRQPFVITFEV